jgi:hypothetical protein
MKRLLQITCILGLLSAAVVAGQVRQEAVSSDEAARAAAVKLFQSLSDEQKNLALKDFQDKERWVEQFPPVERPGLPFTKLTAAQKALVEKAVRAMTSDYGAGRCLEVAKQTPDNRRYLNFFGTPEPGKPFAWRLAQHHLTLLYAEFGSEKVNEFGPVLLGGNPVKALWDEEEKLALALYAALTPDEAKAIKGKGNSASGAPIGTNGQRISDLAEKPRALARKLVEQRLAVFSADRRKVLEDLIRRDGGVDNLRIAFWGEANKSHRDGGNYHWKIGSATVVCDWQTQGKDHIHMTVRGRAKS